MSSRRLFIGLMASAAAQRATSQYQMQCQWPSTARLIDPGRQHITLAFLGNIEDTAEVQLISALAGVPMSPLYLRLTRAEMFSNGAAVLRVEENRALEHLQGDLCALVRSLGLSVDSKPWLPHVTIAREAAGCVLSREPLAIEWDSLQFSLVWSRPSVGYDVLQSWPSSPRKASTASISHSVKV
jgi:2'-5' RNA ligase